jgi:hypothetical protein
LVDISGDDEVFKSIFEKAGLEFQLGYLDLLAMATNRSRSRRKIAPTSQRQAEFLVEGPVDLKLCDT